MDSNSISLGVDLDLRIRGIKRPIKWDIKKSPHLLIAGITGGGKTMLTKYIAYHILSIGGDLYICDYKAGGDWINIVPKYAGFIDCERLFNEFYEGFKDAIANNRENCNKFLIFDEFVSFALSKDTKEFKELMAKLSHIAFMGRTVGYHMILIGQQIHSKVLDTAIREQFATRIYMGQSISLESQHMLFPDAVIDKSLRLPNQCGYFTTLEVGIGKIQVPTISDIKSFNKLLRSMGKGDDDTSGDAKGVSP